MKTYHRHYPYLIFILFCMFFSTSCEEVSNEQNDYWMHRAEQGDPKALFYTSTNRYRMTDDTRINYLVKSAELGYAPAIDEIITRLLNNNAKEDAEAWIALGVEKNSRIAQYYQGKKYYYGEGIAMDAEKGKKLIEESASQGFKDAREELRKINGKTTGLFSKIADEFWSTWYSAEGTLFSRISVSFIKATVNSIPDQITLMLSLYMDAWWKGLLATIFILGFAIGFIYLLFQHRKIEWTYSRSSRTLAWVPFVFLIYGCIITLMSDFNYRLFKNVGRFSQTEETSSIVGTIAVLMTWIVVGAIIYGIVIILKDKVILKNKMMRLGALLLFCVLNYIAGIFLSFIIGVLFVLAIVKGWFVSSNSLIPGGDLDKSCKHKSFSGGCMRGGGACDVEEGRNCPYGML